jgi:hypothetical protein
LTLSLAQTSTTGSQTITVNGFNYTGLNLAAAAWGPRILTPPSTDLAHSNTTGLSNGLIGYWSMDGSSINWSTDTIQDLSGNGQTGTLVSLATTSAQVAGKIGGALKFNGSTSQVTNFPSAISAANTNRTVCAWENTATTSRQGIASDRPTTTGWALTINRTTPGNLTYINNSVVVEKAAGITVGSWFYVCASYNHNTAAVALYVNGLQLGQTTTIAGGDSAGNNGYIGFDGQNHFNGSIDDVRIYNRVLSPQEIAQLYALGKVTVAHSNTVAVSTGLVGYWTFDGQNTHWTTNATDDVSGNGNTGTLVNMSTTSSPTAGKIGQALKFNGTTQYVSLADIPESGNFTVSCWAYPTSFGSSNPVPCVSRAHNGGAFAQNYFIAIVSGLGLGCGVTGEWKFQMSDASGHSAHVCSTAVATLSKWQLVTGIYNVNTQTLSFYVNGVFQGTASGSSLLSSYYTSAESTTIGAYDGSTSFFRGSVDDVRLYGRPLSAQEVAQLYRSGQAMITP